MGEQTSLRAGLSEPPYLKAGYSNAPRINWTSKVGLDCVMASVGILVLLPLLVLIALAVSLDGGPILFRHERIGKDGRRFQCLKFRSMRVDGDRILADVLLRDSSAAREWMETQKLRRDVRVTRIGRILRASSLDELPQLFNILAQDMSLVGPRPIVDQEIDRYGERILCYYATRPGLTGLWQVSGRSDTTYQERVRLDAHYVNNWSFWLDIEILAKTIPAVLLRSGAC